jgi:hypothetical protein
MANYYASCLSNFFKVKDLEKFKNWISKFDSLETFSKKNEEYIAFGSTESGIPDYMMSEDGEDSTEVEFITELSKHLSEGEVAIVQEIGNEKLRYFVGFSVVIDWQGNAKYFDISDAFVWANKKYGRDISRCE